MASDRLTPLDASFLHIENPSHHMHVAATMVFEGSPPPYEDFLAHVESRLHLVPRHRQRIAFVPLGQGRPKWVDDEDFDLRFHVRSTALPRPGTEYQLKVLSGRLFSRPLNRKRPLWEMWLVEGLEGDRFAIVSKTHHAVVDGISAVNILSVLFASDDDADSEPETWRPRPAPGGLSLLAESLLERATMPREALRSALALVRRPRRLASQVLDTAIGLGALAWAGLSPAPSSPYNRPVGPERRVTWVRVRLDDLRAIKAELGGTVNDVVLTVVAGGLRRDLERRGWDVEDLELRVFVPVSVRTEGAGGEAGNQVSGLVVPLPVGSDDPVECLREITVSTRRLKDSGQAVGAQALTELTGFAPANLLDQGSRLAARQRFVNLVVTNVPGPQHALTLQGRELLEIFPLVPLGANLAFGVALVSYNGGINFGLVGDFEAMPDLDRLGADFEAALDELAGAAGVSRNGAPRRPAREPERPERPAEDEPPSEPAHVDTGITQVADTADPGAEDGAGAELRVQEPWPNYDRMRAADIVDRLRGCGGEEVAVVRLYETTHRGRRAVLEATKRELARR